MWETNTWLTRRRSRAESGERSPRPNRTAWRSCAISTNSAGSPVRPLTRAGRNAATVGVSELKHIGPDGGVHGALEPAFMHQHGDFERAAPDGESEHVAADGTEGPVASHPVSVHRGLAALPGQAAGEACHLQVVVAARDVILDLEVEEAEAGLGHETEAEEGGRRDAVVCGKRRKLA